MYIITSTSARAADPVSLLESTADKNSTLSSSMFFLARFLSPNS
jgi:hypothetical protein